MSVKSLKRRRAKRRRRDQLLREQKGRCYYCGEQMVGVWRNPFDSPLGMTFDHKVPRAKGGTREGDNLVLAHWQCNQAKGDMAAEEFMASRATA